MSDVTYERVTPLSHLVATRKGPLYGILLHSINNTGLDPDWHFPAMKRWVVNPANKVQIGGTSFSSGSCADFAVGTQVGEIVQFTDYTRERPNWSAGYGEPRGWSMDDHFLSVELAGNPGVPYAEGTVQNLVTLCADLMQQDIWADGTPPPLKRPRSGVAQTESVPPRGFVGHEDTANGKKYGKIDPGGLFPWAEFFAQLEARMNTVNEDLLTPEHGTTYSVDEDDFRSGQYASQFEQDVIEQTLRWCPDIATDDLIVKIKDLPWSRASAGITNNVLTLTPYLFEDPNPAAGTHFQRATMSIRKSVVHEVAGHLAVTRKGKVSSYAIPGLERLRHWARISGRNWMTDSLAQYEGIAHFISDWLLIPGDARKRQYDDGDEQAFLDLWEFLTNDGPPNLEWRNPAGDYFSWAPMDPMGVYEDGYAALRTPRGLMNQQGWSVFGYYMGQWHTFADVPFPQPGIDDPIPEGAVCYRKW